MVMQSDADKAADLRSQAAWLRVVQNTDVVMINSNIVRNTSLHTP